MVLFLPETLRAIVGDGSIIPPPLYRPVIPLVSRAQADPSADKPPPRAFTNPLRLLTYPDVVILLLFNGIIYAVFYGINTTLSTLFAQIYPFLDETDIGLCFLGIGGGMLFGSAFTGKLLDRDYRRMKESIAKKAQADPEKHAKDHSDGLKEDDFPIELARLRTMPIYLVIFIGCCIGYGWCLQERVNIAGPLVLQILIGYVGVL